MAHYIIITECCPVRRTANSKSERIYEFLFGQIVNVVEQGKEWSRVVTPISAEEGWIENSSVTAITDKQLEAYNSTVNMMVEAPMLHVKPMESYDTLVLPPCSVLPEYNFMTGTFMVAGTEYQVLSPIYWNMNLLDKRERIFRLAMCYLNTPFVRNGRTNSGIDNLNLIVNALSVEYKNLPGTLDELTRFGTYLSFIEEAELGDILLFSNSVGEVSHCGLYIGNGRVLHASGKVRIDRVDHQGIYNPILKRYSFHLAGIITY